MKSGQTHLPRGFDSGQPNRYTKERVNRPYATVDPLPFPPCRERSVP